MPVKDITQFRSSPKNPFTSQLRGAENKTVDNLKNMGYWIVVFDGNAKNKISEIPKDLKKVLIFGSEGKGIRPLILKNCDFKTKISLNVEDRKIDSLNVSNCVSIALYECLRK